jgi:hypothetical protein
MGFEEHSIYHFMLEGYRPYLRDNLTMSWHRGMDTAYMWYSVELLIKRYGIE